MPCGIVQTGRIDPVVSTGKVSGHVHKIAGASSMPNTMNSQLRVVISVFMSSRDHSLLSLPLTASISDIGPNSTYDTLRNASCTSCEIQADKSGYWTPQLYYRHSNGSFEEVPAGGMVVYYLGRGDNRTNIHPFLLDSEWSQEMLVLVHMTTRL